MSDLAFDVLAIEPVRLSGPASLSGRRLMSPYVWGQGSGPLSMLLRIVDDDGPTSGALWFATGDGLNFTAGDRPALHAGPEDFDAAGCEDPTVVPIDDGCLVYYTGLRANGTAQLVYATGPTPDALRKRGVAHASTAADRNTKEAAVERDGERWLLLFEYSRDGRSRVGRGGADDPAGPWDEQQDPLLARAGKWDGWHLSTGPLLADASGGPLMFYNGADEDGNWAIGWVQFDPSCTREVARCDGPLIQSSERDPNGRRIAFAASAVRAGEDIWLYYTKGDRSLFRATLRRRA